MSSRNAHEEDDSLEEEELLPQHTARVELGYPGTGYVPSSAERMRDSDGRIKTASGESYCIPTKAALECIATAFLFFFGTLGSVNSSAVAVEFATTFSSPSTNTTAAASYTTHATQINGNQLATFLSAIVWCGMFFLTLRAFPGVSINPWVTLNHWFFAWKKDGRSFKIDHVVHSLKETITLIGAQFTGGLFAYLMVWLVQGRDTSLIGESYPSDLVTKDVYSMFYEGAASFLFMVLLNLYSRPRRDVSAQEQCGFIALSVFFIVMSFGSYTGANFNAVRTLAPAVLRSILSGVSLRPSVGFYIVGQAAGFALAGVLSWVMNKSAFMQRFCAVTSAAKHD